MSAEHHEDQKEIAEAIQFLQGHGFIFEIKAPLEWQPWMDDFLAAYEKHRRVTMSCGRAGVSPPTMYKYYGLCSKFKARVDAIKPLRVRRS